MDKIGSLIRVSPFQVARNYFFWSKPCYIEESVLFPFKKIRVKPETVQIETVLSGAQKTFLQL